MKFTRLAYLLKALRVYSKPDHMPCINLDCLSVVEVVGIISNSSDDKSDFCHPPGSISFICTSRNILELDFVVAVVIYP